jgi:hypothetical protein
MLDPDLFDEASWGFHVQQATEKALKAWMSAIGAENSDLFDMRAQQTRLYIPPASTASSSSSLISCCSTT